MKGQCKAAKCGQGGFVHGAGLCLGQLIDKESKNWVAGVVLPILAVLVGGGAWWYIRKQRERTRKDTQAFGNAIESHGPESYISRKKRDLGLERLWGFERVWPTRDERSDGDVERGQTDKKRLRELLLSSRTRAKNGGTKRDSMELSRTKYLDHLAESGPGSNTFSIPPPPYAPSSSSSTSGQPSPDPTAVDFSSARPMSVNLRGPVPATTREQLLRTIQHHQDDIDLLSESEVVRADSGLNVRLPMLPPVAGRSDRADKQEEREGEVYRPQYGAKGVHHGHDDGQGRVSSGSSAGRLSALWPNMKGNRRATEGWI